MPTSPHSRRIPRAAVGALGAAALIALGAAPAAVADAPAPPLALEDIAPIDGVEPGSTFTAPVTVVNQGAEAVGKVWVLYSLTRGLDYADLPSNCEEHQVIAHDGMTAQWNAVCAFDQEVIPGAAYAPERPLAFAALDRSLHDRLRVSVWDRDPPLDDAASAPVRGTAPAVRLVGRPAGGNAADDTVEVPVTSVNTAGFQVTGARLAGRVGDTVTLKATFTNTGPAWVLPGTDDPPVHVLITPPAGTSVVAPDASCVAEGRAYACGSGERWVGEDEVDTYTFTLRIDKKVPGATGSVALSTGPRPFDPDKADDRADITLDVTGSGQAGTPGGPAGGSASSTAGRGGSPDSGAATGSSTEGGSSSPGGSGSSSAGGVETATEGDLAATGTFHLTLPVAGAAAVAMALGTGVVLAVRRRLARSRI